jgi:S-adenosylmethionine synthetase
LEVDGVTGVTARLPPEIGRPVDEPVAVEIDVSGDADPAAIDKVRRRAADAFENWREVSEGLMEGRYELF